MPTFPDSALPRVLRGASSIPSLLVGLALCVASPACKKADGPANNTEMTDASAGSDEMVAGMKRSMPLPVDEGIRTGTLDNGMTYFIEKNGKPANKAVLRLAVDAGSLLEEDDQLGIAHFLEHMAFNGTEKFPSNDLVKYLESVGTQFGPHLNAHTSFDETVYKLTVPTDDEEVFDQGLEILKEWACCLALDAEEIEKERGVVLEEWRLREGLQKRVQEVQLPLAFNGSRYVDRLPIGTDDSLKTFDPAVVGRFYDDWYRPDLMAVIVAGDVDVDAVEADLKERFGSLPAAEDPRERERFDVPDRESPDTVVFTDPEMTGNVVLMTTNFDDPQASTWGDWLEREAAALAQAVMRERLNEIARQPDSPYLGAGVSQGRMSPTESSHTVQIGAKEGRLEEAMKVVLTEVKRMREHGVTEPELERAKAQRIAFMDKYEREAEDTDSVSHANEIVRHFLQNEPMPGTVVEADLTRKATNALSKAEVDAWARGFLTAPVATIALLPDKEGLEAPTAEALDAIKAEVDAMEVEPPVTEESLDSLTEPPEGGSIAERDDTWAEDLGFTGIVLDNGVTVYSKKTDLKPGEVLFRGFREGGVSSVDDDLFLNAWAAPRIKGQSGLGEHDPNTIQRYLAGRTVSVSQSLGNYFTKFTGSSATDDLGVALELAWMNVVEPGFTEDGMTVAMDSWEESLRNRRNFPDQQFNDTWRSLFWPEDPRRQIVEPADLEVVELAEAKRIWNEAMGSPDEWTWVFIGDLPDDHEAQVAQWLGALPEAEAGLGMTDRGYHRTPGEFREVLEVGSAERARYRTEWWMPIDEATRTREWRVKLSAFREVLSVLLREKLREDLGGVYGVSVSTSSWIRPYAGVRVRVEYQCDPERLEELEAAMIEVMETLQEEGPEASYIESTKAKNREWWEDTQQNNGFWMRFADALEDDEDPTQFLKFPEMNAKITADDVQDLAKMLLLGDNRGTVVLLPKGATDEE